MEVTKRIEHQRRIGYRLTDEGQYEKYDFLRGKVISRMGLVSILYDNSTIAFHGDYVGCLEEKERLTRSYTAASVIKNHNLHIVSGKFSMDVLDEMLATSPHTISS